MDTYAHWLLIMTLFCSCLQRDLHPPMCSEVGKLHISPSTGCHHMHPALLYVYTKCSFAFGSSFVTLASSEAHMLLGSPTSNIVTLGYVYARRRGFYMAARCLCWHVSLCAAMLSSTCVHSRMLHQWIEVPSQRVSRRSSTSILPAL